MKCPKCDRELKPVLCMDCEHHNQDSCRILTDCPRVPCDCEGWRVELAMGHTDSWWAINESKQIIKWISLKGNAVPALNNEHCHFPTQAEAQAALDAYLHKIGTWKMLTKLGKDKPMKVFILYYNNS